MTQRFDLAIVGAGILGLAHALAAVRRGLSVVVADLLPVIDEIEARMA